MLIKDVVNLVNQKLAGELLSYNEMRMYLDNVVDDINSQLSTTYPTFSELGSAAEYTAFPDRYIRSVVVSGAAWYFYTVDEEGTPTAQQFSADYGRNMFIMQRDMLYNIPEEYQADSLQGTVVSPIDDTIIEVSNRMGEW